MAYINSIFSQFLSLIPRQIFDKLARKNTTGRKERKFSRWSQFVSLIFIQIAERKSLRAGIRNIKAMRSKSYHLGLGKLAASTIGLIYKDRWAIEKFFRWIKQNLKIKTFVGRSENAVLTQIYVALIAYLLLSIMKHMSKIGQSLQQILQIMQLHLMEKVSIEDLFRPPENIKKLKLNLACYR